MGAERGLAGAEPALAPEGAAPLVALRGVRKAFGSGTVAVERLNLDVRDGEFLSLLGPSGCGKSTVLRLIAGLTSKTDGSIQWRGGQPSLGFVFQEPTLAPWSDVFTNVWLPLRLRGMSRADATARIEEALARVELTGFEKAFPRELSGGMKMRVSIARALVMRPALLLLDEPFAALDEITRSRLNDDLLKLKSALGATIVFVTHSVYESVYLSTRITVMAPRPGRVVADIPVDPSLARNEDFRLGSYYAERCRETSAALQMAMGDAEAPGPRHEALRG
ncbi:MAG: ABC transporter ATP-binding protein [Roseiarcus sp.]